MKLSIKQMPKLLLISLVTNNFNSQCQINNKIPYQKMVQFQITKKKASLPSKSLNSSFRNSRKLVLENPIFNGQVLEKIQSRNFDRNFQFSSSKIINQNTNLTARFRATQPLFRKTSLSFNKKITEEVDQMFRKTTLSMRNVAKKNSFFDQLLSQDQIIQQYKIIGQIGKGSFSIVSSAYDKARRCYVAVKIYDKINSLEWHRLQNIKREIHSLKKLSHENVVSLYHVAKEKNKIMIFMENCGKQTLSGLIRKSKVFDQNMAKKLFIQMVNGVKHFHSKGICHRDLKPQNVLIDQKGNAKIIDFGFSSPGKTFLTTFCGTPPFMCPQIVQKRPYSGFKADIWALGVILFLILNGKLPFKATTQQQLYRIIQSGKINFSQHCTNQSAKRLIIKMLKVQPQQRITAEQIVNQKWLKTNL